MGQVTKVEIGEAAWEFEGVKHDCSHMEVILVSKDPELYKLCCQIIGEMDNPNWTIAATESVDSLLEADLYIWDFVSGSLPFPQYALSRNLFLVHRKDLPELRSQVGASAANILLKPVTRATLAAFLGLAISSQEERILAANSLRADRDELLQCLIQTNLKLQEYDQDRTNFLARAVHDFRAPLTALSGYCGLLISEPLGEINENQREVLLRMQHSAKRLSRMADAMFQLSVGRQMKKRPDFKPSDLQQCLDQALHEIAPFAEEKRISISADLAAPSQTLYFEAGQLEQILINILDNACKFTPKAGSIEITGYPFFWERRKINAGLPLDMERRRTVNREPNSYRVDIRDSGAAIPTTHMQRIFEEYTSYAGGRDRSGGGLGLAICKMIALRHDGDIWADNTDSGPMFSFVLPVHCNHLFELSSEFEVTNEV
jgi:signal transduction histidine kinase